MTMRLKTVDSKDSKEYTNFYPAPKDTLSFQVKAAHDAHILLSEKVYPSPADPVIEVLIGGWKNTKSVIRRNRDPTTDRSVETSNFLLNDEWQAFSIEFQGGDIAVRKQNEVTTFLSWKDPTPINVNYFSVKTGWGATGEWEVEFPAVMEVQERETTWVQVGDMPPGSMKVTDADDGHFVGQAKHEQDVIPGMVDKSEGVCHVAWGGKGHKLPGYAVLTGSNLKWEPTEKDNIPSNAIEGGKTKEGEPLYIGRVQYEGLTTVGKVQRSHKVCYFAFNNKEVGVPKYDILVKQ